MGDVNQIYRELLSKEFESLERERRRQYEYLVDELVSQEMVRETIHVDQALKIEITYMKRFIDYALSKFKEVINSPEVSIDGLEKTYRDSINLFFSKSLQRMLGIIINVRGPLKDDYAQEPLEKLKSEALRELEMIKTKQ